MIVVNTNLLVYLYVPGAHTARAEAVFQRDPLWMTPLLWRSEFRNTLAGLIRQDTLTLDTALRIARPDPSPDCDSERQISLRADRAEKACYDPVTPQPSIVA